ncbi:MAG: thioredoxin domain-containing protein [Bifidobacteriaceae bacterium]|jgi:protein-disulfide isomerase|nr:thioredoxin domain-containing protein [Bifidobacteriaceae bacterium]
MANSKKKTKPTAAQIRQDARAKAQAEVARLKAQQAAKAKRIRIFSAIGALVVVAAVIVVVVLVMNAQKHDYENYSTSPTEGQYKAPLGYGEYGGVALNSDMEVGTATTGQDVVVVRIYSDYLCPGCGEVEKRYGDQLEQLNRAGTIALELVPMATLDSLSNGTEYSSRAANAALAVADLEPDHFWAFHKALFENQPAENSDGLTDDEIKQIAIDAGVSEATAEQLATREYDNWLEYAYNQFASAAVRSNGSLVTPAIMLGRSDGTMQLMEKLGEVSLDQGVANVLAGLTPDGATKE